MFYLVKSKTASRKAETELNRISIGETVLIFDVSLSLCHLVNPLSPSIKLQILFLCFHTFLTEVVGRSC